MAKNPLRVVVWATGGIGSIAIHAIQRRPDIELVACMVQKFKFNVVERGHHVAVAIFDHAAYDNECKWLGDSESILTLVKNTMETSR